MKKALSLLLCVVLLFGMIPVVTTQAETDNAAIEMQDTEASVSGTNSLGNLLSEGINQAQEEAESAGSDFSGGYVVADVSIEGNIATVEYSCMEEANLIVALYSEDGMQLLTSGNAVVSAEETVATVTIEGTMPQYFMASAYLVDIYDYSPLCPAYDTPMYTEEMQELLASTVEDYDQEKIVNFDDSIETNFAVCNDSVIIIEAVEGYNTVIGSDNENTYTIVNIDSQIQGLKAGDIFVYEYTEEDVLIAKIASITLDGTSAVITCDDLELEEVFSQMKIESFGDTRNITVDESTGDESVTYLGLVEVEPESSIPKKLEGSLEGSVEATFGLEKEYSSVSVKGTLSLQLGAELEYYVTWERRFVKFELKSEAKFELEVSGEFPVKLIKLPETTVRLCFGVSAVCKPEVQLKFEGKTSFSLKMTQTDGISYDSKTKKFQDISQNPTVDTSLTVEGKIFIGVDMKPTVEVFKGAVVELSITALAGVEITGELSGLAYDGITIAGGDVKEEQHSCNTCIKFEINAIIELGASVKFPLFDKVEFSAPSFKKEFKLGKAYYSCDNNKFGWGECPSVAYRVTFQVLNENNQLVSGAVVSDSNGNTWGKTGSNGVFVSYLPVAHYNFTAEKGEINGSTSAEIVKSSFVTIRIGSNLSCPTNISSGGILGTVENSGYVDEGVYASGVCGDNVSWKLSNTGTLYIFGTGAMRDFSAFNSPWNQYKSEIKNVVINEGVTIIGHYAFRGCRNLTSVTVPDSVITIGWNAFAGCSSLKNIMIPNSVTTVAENAFHNCNNLPYTVYDNAKYLGNSNNPHMVLIECINTTIVSCQIHPNTKVISKSAFKNCNFLTSVIIGNGVTTIDESVFMGCSSLTTITIPDSVTSIGGYAFSDCSSLTAITIPDSVTSIGGHAFYNCSSLTTITIPDSVTSIGDGAFYNCSNLRYTIYDNAKYLGNSENPYVVLVESSNNFIVSCKIHPNTKSIIVYAFYDCNKLISITIPDSVTRIGGYAFYNCSSLTTITIPDSVTSIGSSAFYNCSSLTTITIPDGVTSIGGHAFTNCSSLTTITIPDGVTSIGDYAFYNCSSLTSVTIGDSVTSIGSSAFSDCSSLTSITIPDSVTSIGSFAFSGCSSLTSLSIPDSVTSIAEYAFRNCSSLTKITIPDSVTSIDNDAFRNCSSLTTITIPGNVANIQERAFSGCSNLKQIKFIGDAVSLQTNAFYNVNATAYYPSGNTTWTSSVMQNYGGNITWVPYTPTKSATKNLTADEDSQVETIEASLATAEETATSESAQDKRPVKGVFGGEYETEETENYILKKATFQNLVPGQEYLLLALISTTAEQPLESSNLLYVDQAQAQEDGTLIFQYVQRENTAISYVMACGASNKNLQDATVTFPVMCADEEVQVVNPTVVYNGKTLTEGLDYTLVGTVDFTEAGSYTCYIRGIYNYTGLVPCAYEVLDKSVITAWNLTLGEKISMNFYMDIEDTIKETATVNISVAGESISYPAADAVKDETTGQYVFTVDLAATQMTEGVTVAVVNEGQAVSTKSYSVRQYADYVLDESRGYADNIQAIVKEMLNYGAAAQVYFDYDTENLANDGITGVAATDVPKTAEKVTVSDQISNVNFYGASLVYRDRIAVRYYFTGDVTGCTFTANGNTYTPVAKDGMHYVEIADILPQDLDQAITLTVTDADGNVLNVAYNPMNYIVRMNEKGSDTLKALVKALYNYHLAAKALSA